MKATKADLEEWVRVALLTIGRSGTLVDVARQIWLEHQLDLQEAGDLFYTWQYDMRWAAERLRKKGIMKRVDASSRGVWELA
jgi:hypothetical protein